MDHPLKRKWHSYLIETSTDGKTAQIQQDGANHEMDLSKMKDNGDLDQGTHNGKPITGKAIPLGNTFFLTLNYVDGSRTYEGVLVRDKSFGGFTIKLVSGRYIFRKLFDEKAAFQLLGNSAILTEQEEGSWVITHP